MDISRLFRQLVPALCKDSGFTPAPTQEWSQVCYGGLSHSDNTPRLSPHSWRWAEIRMWYLDFCWLFKMWSFFFFLWGGMDSWPLAEASPIGSSIIHPPGVLWAQPSNYILGWDLPLDRPGRPQCSFSSTWQPCLIERFPGIFMWKPKKILQGRF